MAQEIVISRCGSVHACDGVQFQILVPIDTLEEIRRCIGRLRGGPLDIGRPRILS